MGMDVRPEHQDFFKGYPAYYDTSHTSPSPNRLNRRVDILIKDNEHILRGQKVLDIASHDGRFSFAALKYGASHVTGVEGKPELVENSVRNMDRYEIPESDYDFIVGDIHEEIPKLDPGEFDVIFCFGFFYHTIHHAFLLSEIRRLNPEYLILDTNVLSSDEPMIRIAVEGGGEGSAIVSEGADRSKTLVGKPSRSAVELMLRNMRFSATLVDWADKGIDDWKSLDDYKTGKRITYVARME